MYQRHRPSALLSLPPCAKVASLECTGDGVITSGASSSADRGERKEEEWNGGEMEIRRGEEGRRLY